MERIQSNPSEGKKGKFINSKRVGIFAIIGIGLIAAYKCDDSESSKVAPAPIAISNPEVEDPAPKKPPLKSSKAISNEERIRNFFRGIQGSSRGETLDGEVETGKISPSAHFSLLSDLMGEEKDGIELKWLLQSYEIFTKCYAKNALSNKNLEVIFSHIEAYAGGEDQSELKLYRYAKGLKKHCKLNESSQDQIISELNIRIQRAASSGWISGLDQSELYRNLHDGNYDEVRAMLDALVGNREKIEMILGNMLHHSGVSDDEHVSGKLGYIKKSEWEYLSDMPIETKQDVLNKLGALVGLGEIIMQRFNEEHFGR